MLYMVENEKTLRGQLVEGGVRYSKSCKWRMVIRRINFAITIAASSTDTRMFYKAKDS